jgi:hypothetical protein
VQHLSRHARRILGTLGTVRMAATLVGVLGLSLAVAQIAPVQTANASPLAYYYQRGYYLDNGWLCHGWANGTYHCTQHWHRAANGTLISDHASWVPNVQAPASDPPAAHSTIHRGATHSVSHPAAPPAARPAAPASAPATSTGGIAAEIRAVFGPYGNQAVAVATCESGLNPNAANPNSTARGVFQFLSSTWATTSYAGYSPFNAWANIQAAHQVFARDGYSWREWVCQP